MRLFTGLVIAAILGLGWILSHKGSHTELAEGLFSLVPEHRSAVIEALTVANRDCTYKIYGNLPAVLVAINGNIFVAAVDLPSAKAGRVSTEEELEGQKRQQLPKIEQRLKENYGSFSTEQIKSAERLFKDSSAQPKLVNCVMQQSYSQLKLAGLIP